MEKTSKVAIIGAGVSGISAAIKLIEAGFENVTIFEASSRIGGRINSISFGSGGSMIDLGAQWISGKNTVFHLMKDHFEFGDTNITETIQIYLTTSDEQPDKKKLAQLLALGNSLYADEFAFKDEMKVSSDSYGEFAKKKYFEGLQKPEYDDIDRELTNMVLLQMQKEFNVLYATSSWNDVPAKMVADNEFAEGSQMMTWKKSGYKTMLDFLIKNLKEKTKIDVEDKVLFNKKVVNINYTTENVWIKCQDESEHRYDHVITTFPHGFLKANYETLFTPRLSDAKIEAIESIGFGTLGKVFFEFKERIFQNDERCLVFLWSESDLADVRGTDKEWLVQIHGFMHVDQQPNMIEGLLAGKLIREFETFEDEKIIRDCHWLLEKFLKRHLDRPINMTRTRWLTNENFLGSYAFPSMKAKDDSFESLSKSIDDEHGKPLILFGGEATSKDHQGYVHGAMEQGWRVAKEIIDYWQ